MSGLRLDVDRHRCVGMGSCVFAAPDVFTQNDDDGRVEVLDPTPDETLRPQVEEAADMCPVAAIRWGALEEQPRGADR